MAPAELCVEESHFKDYILPSSPNQTTVAFCIVCRFVSSEIVRSQQNHGESNVGKVLEFLNDRAAEIFPLVQDDCFKFQLLKESRSFKPRRVVVPMHNEDPL